MKYIVCNMSSEKMHYPKQREVMREYGYQKDILNNIYPDVDLWFYTSSYEENKNYVDYDKNMVYVDSNDSFEGTAEKTVKFLDILNNVIYKEEDEYWVILTNQITILNIKKIISFINDNNDKKFLGGVCIPFRYMDCSIKSSFIQGRLIMLHSDIVRDIINDSRDLLSQDFFVDTGSFSLTTDCFISLYIVNKYDVDEEEIKKHCASSDTEYSTLYIDKQTFDKQYENNEFDEILNKYLYISLHIDGYDKSFYRSDDINEYNIKITKRAREIW